MPYLIYWLIDKESGLLALSSLRLGRLLNGLIKNTACVPRPWMLDSRILPSEEALSGATGFSFPSGHATTSTAIFGSIAIKNKKGIVKILCWLFIILMAFARNFLGVHTLIDVLAGIGITYLLVLILNKFLPSLKDNTDKSLKVLIGVICLSILAIIYSLVKSYPSLESLNPYKLQKGVIKDAGALIGFSVGYYLMNKYATFDTNNMNIKKLIIRLIVGIILMDGFYFSLKNLDQIMNDRIAGFISYFIRLFVGTFIVPLGFTKLENKFINNK